MKALLLAAGYGTRLRPLTDTIPKCLIPIRNRALLDYWLDLLMSGNIDSLLINTHYLPELVSEFISKSIYRNKIEIVHENYLLGTAGTIWRNRDWLGRNSFFFAHADNLTRFDLEKFQKAHYNRCLGTCITMMTFRTDDPKSCGIVELDKVGLVKAFYEKVENPPSNLANAAVYIIEPEVVDFIGSIDREIIDFSTEILPNFIGRIGTWHNDDYHRDIGTPRSMALAEKEF